MKKLFQIGIVLLFMIGLCSVQLDYSTSILVDDDVGVEFVTSISITENDAILITMIINNPSQVAAPLKYPTVASEMDITYNRNSEVWKEFTTDCTMPMQVVTITRQINYSEISSTNLTNNYFKSGKGCQTNASKYIPTNQNRLYRLDIGENFYIKNLI